MSLAYSLVYHHARMLRESVNRRRTLCQTWCWAGLDNVLVGVDKAKAAGHDGIGIEGLINLTTRPGDIM